MAGRDRKSRAAREGEGKTAWGVFRHLFCHVFFLSAAALVFVIVPFDFLYSLSSFVRVMPVFEIVSQVAAVVLLLLTAAALFACSAGLAGILLRLFAGARAERFTEMIFDVVIVFGSLFVIYRLAMLWAVKFPAGRSVLAVPFVHKGLMILFPVALLALGVLAVVHHEGFRARLRGERQRFLWPVVFALLASVVVLGVRYPQAGTASGGHASAGPGGGTGSPVVARNPRNVILISFDALSAEDMSLHGFHLATTPHMEELGRRSYVFDRMFANYNCTRPAVTSMLTGRYPSTHGLTNDTYGTRLPEAARGKNLARILRDAGYYVVTVNANEERGSPWVNDTWRDYHEIYGSGEFTFYGLTPLFEKFETRGHIWLDSMWKRYITPLKYHSFLGRAAPRPAGRTFSTARRELGRLPRPFFLWVHLYPPHAPYLPGDGFRYRFLREEVFTNAGEIHSIVSRQKYEPSQQARVDKLHLRYDEHILDCDHALGGFVAALREGGFTEDSIVIVTSDHGEIFERGLLAHQVPYLYQPLIHIPLIIHLPGQEEGKRITSNAEQVDLAPTILDLVGLPLPAWMEGESLVPAMSDGTRSGKPKYSMVLADEVLPWRKAGRKKVAVMKDGYKFIYDVSREEGELYDLTEDPGETKDLAAADKERSSVLEGLIGRRILKK